jgi:cell division protein FtsQ
MWSEARIINALANSLVMLAALALLVAGIFWSVRLPIFALQKIEIVALQGTNLNHITSKEIQSALTGRLTGNFFTINLPETRDVFETLPWVRYAAVRRIWPNTLRVSIEEQQPLALWNDTQMVNTWGQLFIANRAALDNEDSLPQFVGPDGSERLLVQRYTELTRWFAPLELRAKRLTLSDRYAWQVSLSNGMTLDLGRDPGADAPDPQGGIPGALSFAQRIERFVDAWPQAQKKLQGRIATHADLRYPNGFALTLAALSEPIHSKKKP